EAQERLSEALRLLDPAHSDAVCARSHLNALVSGDGCRCDDQGKALAEAFREFVLAQLPSALLERLDVEPKDGNFSVRVQLKRGPSQEQVENLDRTIKHALKRFRVRVAERQ